MVSCGGDICCLIKYHCAWHHRANDKLSHEEEGKEKGKAELVEGKIGKGRWIYIGLGLWRQLPAGTDGAYQLLANLISLGKIPGVPVGLTSPVK